MRLAALMVTETMPSLTKIHSAVPPITPMNPASPGSASTRKCRFTIAWNASGGQQPGHQRRGDPGRRGHHHRLVRPDRHRRPRRSPAPSPGCFGLRSAAHPAAGQQPAAALPRSHATAGSMKLSDRPSRGKQRDAGAAAACINVSSTTARSSRASAASGGGVQRGHRQRLQQPPIQCAVGSSASATVASAAGPAQREQRQIVAQTRCPAPGGRGGTSTTASGPRSGAHRPALAGGEVDERKQRLGRPAQGVAWRRSCRDSRMAALVAGQQQMVAVVDAAAERRDRNRTGSARRPAGPAS